MSMNDTYQPINCDDYDNLELACQHHLMLTLELKDGEKLQAKASVGESEVEESQTEEVKNTVSVSDGVIKLFIIGGVAGG